MSTIRKEHMTPEFQILRMNSSKFYAASGNDFVPTVTHASAWNLELGDSWTGVEDCN